MNDKSAYHRPADATQSGSRLRSENERCLKAQQAVVIAAVVLIGGFYLLGYRPLSERLDILARQIEVKQRDLDANQTRARDLPAVAREVEALRYRLERFDKKLPKSQDHSDFVRQIGRIQERSGLRLVDTRHGEVRKNELFSEQPVEMVFDGNFINVYAFLREVEDLQRLTRIQRLEMRTRDPAAGQVQVNLTMMIYFLD